MLKHTNIIDHVVSVTLAYSQNHFQGLFVHKVDIVLDAVDLRIKSIYWQNNTIFVQYILSCCAEEQYEVNECLTEHA